MKVLRGSLIVLAAAAIVIVKAGPASATEEIRSYSVAIVIGTDGVLNVTETIDYDFGVLEKHGIFLDVRTRLRYDTEFDRIYPLAVESVEATNAPSRWELSNEPGGVTRIKVGDPDVTVTGAHTYTIRYTVQGALNGFDDHDELYWNAIGLAWPVFIRDAKVTVEAPGAIEAAVCFAGPEFSNLPCRRATSEGRVATFRHSGMYPYEGLTVAVAFPKGLVPTPAPILEQRLTLASAFDATATTVPVAAGSTVVLLSAIAAFAWSRGRDRRFRGSQVAQVMGGTEGDEPVPLFDADSRAPVEFAPPEGIRPGQVGTLMDEKANTLDVTATIVDLAVRGHLSIREIPKEGWFGKPDWALLRRETDEVLLPYESKLMEGLFRDGDEVKLSDLRTTFVSRLHEVQEALYEDLTDRKWFASSPKAVRRRWGLIGLFVTLVGGGLTGFLATMRLGLVGLPVLVSGIFLLWVAGRMPARTAKGTAMLRRLRGFETVIEKAEAHMSRWAEQENVFTRYLPYAIVFGCTERWAKAFEGLGQEPDTGWYVGTGPFAYSSFADSMGSFIVTTAGTIASTPGGSGGSGFGGGGFSGGGGGGGGGGSW